MPHQLIKQVLEDMLNIGAKIGNTPNQVANGGIPDTLDHGPQPTPYLDEIAPQLLKMSGSHIMPEVEPAREKVQDARKCLDNSRDKVQHLGQDRAQHRPNDAEIDGKDGLQKACQRGKHRHIWLQGFAEILERGQQAFGNLVAQILKGGRDL